MADITLGGGKSITIGQATISFDPKLTVSGGTGNGITIVGTPTIGLSIGGESVGGTLPVNLTLPTIPDLLGTVLGNLGAKAITFGSGADTASGSKVASLGSFGSSNSTMLSASAVKAGGTSFGADAVGGKPASLLAGSPVITNFLSGAEKLVLNNNTVAYLTKPDVSSHGGTTLIALDGGKTTIEMIGVSSDLKSTDLTHKH